MAEDIHVYTITMARIYAGQGHLEKARRIYRHIIAQNPADLDAREALNELDTQIANGGREADKPDLSERIKEWADLAGQYNRIQRIKKLAQKFSSER